MRIISDHMREVTLSTSYLYRGRIINVRQDRVKVQSGKVAFREVVEHPGAVAVLAVNESNKVFFVRQHRQPAGEILLEIPAGKLEIGEEPLKCARRELLEETGLEAEDWMELIRFYPSPGFCDEMIYLFQAGKLSETANQNTDPEEFITVEKISLNDAAEMIADGRIRDGKTIIAIQFALLDKL
ncbi:MAG: NUDIX hydrolase [Bacillota bacterium]|nr:NUDIX hydrolase [Bacillota bacterium]